MAFANLTEEDKSKLKEKYVIPEGAKQLYTDELDYIINYRTKVLDVLESFWMAKASASEKIKTEAFEKMVSLAENLTAYMKQASALNVMRRLVFIKNIESEFNVAQVFLIWKVKENSSNLYRETTETAKGLSEFYQYICAEALLKDGLLDSLRAESAQIVAETIKSRIEDDFLKNIQPGKYVYSDIFYLLGHYKKKIDAKSDEMKKIDKEKCEGCSIDDCLVSHCSDMNRKIELEAQKKDLEVVYKTCLAKVFGQEVSEEMKVETIKRIPENRTRQITSDLLDMDLSKLHNRKRIILDLGGRKNVCVEPDKITEVLAKSIEGSSTLDSWGLNDIATGIVLNDYDLSRGTGDIVCREFFDRHLRLKKTVDFEMQYSYSKEGSIAEFMKAYVALKNKKQEELGGNE